MDELVTSHIMIICVYRPEREHKCYRLRTQAQRKCFERYTEIQLQKLTDRQGRQLVQSLLTMDNLTNNFREMILSKSEGNPFVIEEIIRSLMDRGVLYREGDRWKVHEGISEIDVPDTIHSVIMSRIDRLEAETKYVLQCASVIGRLFRYRLLGHLVRNERELDGYLEELEDRELVYEERSIPELEYAFKHALTQEAAYQGIDVLGMDISHGALSVAANHASTVGQEIQYVCADPMYPPFRSGCFDLLLSKDALHHLHDPYAALERLCQILRSDGHLLAYEHVGNSRLVSAIIDVCARVLIPRIERRYARVSIPPVFQCPSVLEDVGIIRVVDALRSFFQPSMEYGELMLYFELEQLVYYACGKRRGIASLVRNLTFAIEKILLLFTPPDHLSFFGQRKPPAGKSKEEERPGGTQKG